MASRTPLFEWHRAAGARFIEFGGWEMPLQYSGIVDEHLTVRQAVGLFDVSHMGKIFVEGPTAHAFLDHLSANDVPTLAGKARYTHLLREDGTILDDVIVTCLAADRFLLVCNAGPVRRSGHGSRLTRVRRSLSRIARRSGSAWPCRVRAPRISFNVSRPWT